MIVPTNSEEVDVYEEIDPKVVSSLSKRFLDFFKFIVRVLVVYIYSLLFLLTSLDFLFEEDISGNTRWVFLLTFVLLVTISGTIHFDKFGNLMKEIMWIPLVVLMGNVSGFLFNLVYLILNFSAQYNYPIPFGGLEKYIFSTNNEIKLNMIHSTYLYSGTLLFFISMYLIIANGLLVKDVIKKEGGGYIKRALPIIASITLVCVISFLVALTIKFFPDFAIYCISFITGSMVFIYGLNIFNQRSRFLSLDVFLEFQSFMKKQKK